MYNILLGFVAPIVVSIIVGLAASFLTAERMLVRLEVQMQANRSQIDKLVKLQEGNAAAIHDHEKSPGHAVAESRIAALEREIWK